MALKHFTLEQIKELNGNPYVKNATEKYINYTEEFKELFITEYRSGMMPSEIFRKYGFDTTVLGKKRITSFCMRVKQQIERPEGFEDQRKDNSGRPDTLDLTPEEIIERLKQQNEILRQENDFLKRVRYINRKQISKQRKG